MYFSRYAFVLRFASKLEWFPSNSLNGHFILGRLRKNSSVFIELQEILHEQKKSTEVAEDAIVVTVVMEHCVLSTMAIDIIITCKIVEFGAKMSAVVDATADIIEGTTFKSFVKIQMIYLTLWMRHFQKCFWRLLNIVLNQK